MLGLTIASSLFFGIGLYLLSLNQAVKNEQKKRFLYHLNPILPKHRLPGYRAHYQQIHHWLKRLIYQSGIKKWLPWFNETIFLILLSVAATLVYLQFSGVSPFIALTYCIIALVAGFAVLLLLVLLNKNKVRRSFLSFLTVYSNFYDTENNEMQALEKAADYIEDPLRHIIKRWVTRYNTLDKISFSDTLNGILLDTGNEQDFRKFINITKLNHQYGGDYQMALKKMIRQGEYKEESLSKKASTAAFGTGLILFMVLLDLTLLFSLVNQADLASFMHSAKGQLHIFFNALAILASFGFVLNINK